MEPPNSGHHWDPCTCLSFVERLSSFGGYFVQSVYTWCVLCWEVCPLSECPLLEVSLYIICMLPHNSWGITPVWYIGQSGILGSPDPPEF